MTDTLSPVPSDVEIAQRATLRPIGEVGDELGVPSDGLIPYGTDKAKIALGAILGRPPHGKLVLVTGISPTPAGEGKSTLAIGLAQALRRMRQSVAICLRQPSLGPVFGIKGGAAGGGYAQVLPMADINLHFTGDFHAIATAQNLLAAMVDNHIFHGNERRIRSVVWPRTMDMNDRALRSVRVGYGKDSPDGTRADRFVIVAASEIMAVLSLATDRADLESRLERLIVGFDDNDNPVRAADIHAAGAMSLLLKDALLPNLVQTLEGGPALVHCGPFGNIAHGCNSIIATRAGLAFADIVLTEAGFGADLGAEKFFDIKCPAGGLTPAAAVIVATIRALKFHGGVPVQDLRTPDVDALQRGLDNLAAHLDNLAQFGVPVTVALNRFSADSADEIAVLRDFCSDRRVRFATADVWTHGGAGGEELAAELLASLNEDHSEFQPLFPADTPVEKKIEALATRIYGADGVDWSPAALEGLERARNCGLANAPVCMAKTQYSLSDNPKLLGMPKNFRLRLRELHLSAGAGFVVPIAGNIMTMPGLPKKPAANSIRILPDGKIEGLF